MCCTSSASGPLPVSASCSKTSFLQIRGSLLWGWIQEVIGALVN
uniref:Uncharacterized protein n=1 Tax=Arundo donax TaxID=35708 RepID=A0A0A9HTE9_ARUDO